MTAEEITMRYFALMPILCLVVSALSHAQITTQYDSQHRLNPVFGPGNELKANLSEHFGIYKCAFDDTIFEREIDELFCAEIAKLKPEYAGVSCDIKDLFAIEPLRHIVFLIVPDPENFHFSISFGYNIVQKRQYLLGKASVRELMQMLETESFHLYTDGEILEYCRLITLLKHPGNYVRFIADVKQLMLEAAGRKAAYYDLERVKQFRNIKIDMPTIKREGRDIKVTYYAAEYDKVLKITATIADERVREYTEKEVGKFPYWYGLDQRMW